ncbi:MAG: DUF4347 domain-containing protein [Methylobacter tundripaludum]|nr:DUF4347 domain-containing protein [Methylobacter tundripaludum]
MKFIKNLFKWKTGKINSSLPAPVIKPCRTMMMLEPRIMFDGAAAETTADAVTDSDPLMQDTAVIDQDAAKLAQAAADVVPPAAEPQRNEIVFIENNVADYQQLENGVKPGTEVYVLDAGQDGLAQMAQILAGRSGIDAIHIVSHGSDGAVLFGATFLSSENLQQYSGELAVIGGALTQNGDILLYGCDVGAGASGAAFVSELASATGADVAASSGPTGSAALGGDWRLETQTGVVESSIALTDAETADYGYLLFTENYNTDPGLGAFPSSFTLNGFTYAFSGGDGGSFAWDSSLGVGGTGAVTPFSNSTNTNTTETITITYASGAFSFTSIQVKSQSAAWTFTGKLSGSTAGTDMTSAAAGFQSVSFGSPTIIDTLVITAVNFDSSTDAFDDFITTVPPVNTVPGAQTMLEDTTLTFSSGNGNAITVSDQDSTSLSVTSGSGGLTLAGTGGLSFTTGDGSADETMTFSGTITDINTALDGLQYTPIANAFGSGYSTLTIAAGDGSSTDTDTVTINVTGVNDTPTLTATASNPTFTEGGAAVTLFSGAAIGTVENGQTITSLTLTVSNVASTDVLNIDGSDITLTDLATVASTATNAMTVNVSVTGGTATVTITKAAGISRTNAQTLVNGVSYRNSGDDPTASGTTRVAPLTQIKDSGGTSNGGVDSTTLSVASTVTLTPINDAPTLTATASNPTFTEGGSAATLFSSAAVSAVESADNIEQLVLTVSNVTDGAAEILSIDGSSVALTHGNSVTTASNSMTAGVSLSGNTATVTLSKAGGITRSSGADAGQRTGL